MLLLTIIRRQEKKNHIYDQRLELITIFNL